MELPKGPASMRGSAEQTPPLQTPTDSNGQTQLTSTTQLARPYLTQNQILHAQKRTIENRQVYDQRKSQILGFLMKICNALRFPLRTLETAMSYYQRYFLYNKFDTTIYHDVAIVCLFVSSKNEDTVKKLRDLIVASCQLRNIQWTPEQIENHKKKLMSLEFKLLETISFDFRSCHIEEYVVKICKTLQISKDVAHLAWLIAYDSFQLEVGIKIPANSIAFAVIQIALRAMDLPPVRVMYKDYFCSQFAVNEAVLDILNFYVNAFNFSLLANVKPELKDKFFNIKLNLDDERVLSEPTRASIEKDQYFKERDFTVGERRYMLGNQFKRLYAEIDK